MMVACVSPADINMEESSNTLRYAQRARAIQNSAVRNVVATTLTAAEAAQLRRENQMLKLQLLQAQMAGAGGPGAAGPKAPGGMAQALINGVNVEKLEVSERSSIEGGPSCFAPQARSRLCQKPCTSNKANRMTTTTKSISFRSSHFSLRFGGAGGDEAALRERGA